MWMHQGSAGFLKMKYHGAFFFCPDLDEKKAFADYIKFVTE